jgi:hypothetical protein
VLLLVLLVPPACVAVALVVILSVGLVGLIGYWIWQDKKAAKKAHDTSGTVEHYQKLDDASKAGSLNHH